MKITLTVEVELTHLTGKFISKDDVADALCEEITDPGTVYVEETEYEVADWNVSIGVTEPAPRRKRTKRPEQQGLACQEARR
jgi:predicted SpoU family rRNA methylase